MKTKEKEIEELDDRIAEYCIHTTYSDDFDFFEKQSKEKILMISYDKSKKVTLWDKHRIIPECGDFGIMNSLIHNDNLSRIKNGSVLLLKDDDSNTKVIIIKLDTARDIYFDLQRSLKL